MNCCLKQTATWGKRMIDWSLNVQGHLKCYMFQVFLATALFFGISFSSNLSVSSTDTLISLKSFSNFKRLFFTFRILFFQVFHLSMFVFCSFVVSNDSSLYIVKEKNIRKLVSKNIIFQVRQVILSEFKWFLNGFQVISGNS